MRDPLASIRSPRPSIARQAWHLVTRVDTPGRHTHVYRATCDELRRIVLLTG